MKKQLLIILGILAMYSCNNKNNENQTKDSIISSNNALLATKVEIDCRIPFDNENNPNWVKGLNREKFVNNIFSKILSGKFTEIYKRDEKYTISNVEDRMGVKFDTTITFNKKTNKNDTSINKTEINLSEIKEILFNEEWKFDKKEFGFEKKINSWSFIRKFYRQNDIKQENPRYLITFQIKRNEDTKPELKIASDFTYIFEFRDEYLDRVGLDKKGLLNYLIPNIESGKIKVFDPIYLVDKSKRVFTPQQFKNYTEIDFADKDVSKEINKMIYIEDWYLDEKTFNISKKVKALGFVENKYDDKTGEWTDKILFFIFFE